MTMQELSDEMRKERARCSTHCGTWNREDRDCEIYGEHHCPPSKCRYFLATELERRNKELEKMPISKETLKEMKKYNFHTISENDTEGKMCATCDYGTCLMGGTPAYCYKTGLRIDWDFICNQYKELVRR